MSAGLKFADVVFWGTNGAVEVLLEALIAQAERQLGTADPLTTFLRDERDGFYMGKVVVIDEPLATTAARQRFLSLMNDASQELLREGPLTDYGSAWLSTEITALCDHIRGRDGSSG
ncbi:hypothetical protein [Gemmata sp.]|uniref:hypothetical protein n=1 Tax=Gemmata sp. TaxID=1914242 RepID=UPI003F70586B